MPNYNKRQMDAARHAEFLLQDMPAFCRTYYNHKEGKIHDSSRLNYVQKLKKFFEFLHSEIPALQNKPVSEISLEDISMLTVDDIEEFEHWIRIRRSCPNVRDKSSQIRNRRASATTVNSYLAALNSFWEYFVRKGILETNPVSRIERDKPGTRQHIPHLGPGESKQLVKAADTGTGNTKHAAAYHNKTAVRDTAILLLMLRTGLRVSEVAGIDVSDIDLTSVNAPRIFTMRKGESEDYVYLDDETARFLKKYIEIRKDSAKDDEPALFISYFGQKPGTRMSVRGIEKLVHKYSKQIGDDVYPHALRATYATDLFQYVDVGLIQKALNHSSPTTTMRYADNRTKNLKGIRNVLMEKENKNAAD